MLPFGNFAKVIPFHSLIGTTVVVPFMDEATYREFCDDLRPMAPLQGIFSCAGEIQNTSSMRGVLFCHYSERDQFLPNKSRIDAAITMRSGLQFESNGELPVETYVHPDYEQLKLSLHGTVMLHMSYSYTVSFNTILTAMKKHPTRTQILPLRAIVSIGEMNEFVFFALFQTENDLVEFLAWVRTMTVQPETVYQARFIGDESTLHLKK